MEISGKSIKFSLLSLMCINIAFRYPRTNHQVGADGFLIHGLANELAIDNYAGWLIHPLSTTGLYPFSYASGFILLLASIKQITYLPMESIVLLFCVFLSIFGLMGSFILAREVIHNNLFALISSFIFSLSPVFISLTLWDSSTRHILVAFFPLWNWLLLKCYYCQSKRGTYILIMVIVSITTFTFHRVSFLMLFPIISYILSIGLHRIFNQVDFSILAIRAMIASWFLLFTSIILLQAFQLWIYKEIAFVTSYQSGRFFTGDQFYNTLLNMTVDYGSRYGIFSVFGAIGLIFFMKESVNQINRLFILLAILSLAWFITQSQYLNLVLLPYMSLLIGFGLFRTMIILKNKQISLSPFIISLVCMSLLFSNFMVESWASLRGEHYSMTEDEYDAAIISRYFINQSDAFIAQGNILGHRMLTISNGSLMNDGILALHYGWIKKEYITTDIDLEFMNILNNKSFIIESNIYNVEQKWRDNIFERLYQSDINSTKDILSRYNIVYAYSGGDPSGPPFFVTANLFRYRIFENDEIKILYLGY